MRSSPWRGVAATPALRVVLSPPGPTTRRPSRLARSRNPLENAPFFWRAAGPARFSLPFSGRPTGRVCFRANFLVGPRAGQIIAPFFSPARGPTTFWLRFCARPVGRACLGFIFEPGRRAGLEKGVFFRWFRRTPCFGRPIGPGSARRLGFHALSPSFPSTRPNHASKFAVPRDRDGIRFSTRKGYEGREDMAPVRDCASFGL